MSKPNYQAMALEELKQYILEHRDDEDALQSEAKTGTTEDFLESVKQKLFLVVSTALFIHN
jgi:hypothetical protein